MRRCSRKHLEILCAMRGHSFESVLPSIVADHGDWLTVDPEHPAFPKIGSAPPQAARKYPQPGTELKRLLKDWLGIEESKGCRCSSMSARMDALGVEWCESEAGMAEILGVMREEHGRRRLAGETILPWTDFGATQLVRLACRRARAT